ncbi:polyunsaturated fatty acid synthase PfaB [Colwellia sp. MT41]|uniref:PfaB family protein n=1 Tax=Colwellia sp. MT41 TaxID=58049 RepID=UPI000717B6D9|nr:PfaB family protein [Colwellia sp. MT41]ALO34523.1 polyunsaturated fatty acid synthase PfaB [Colwellia sp. MT41]
MAKGNYSSAIIGLDAQFENQFTVQNNIDNVERALYLGKVQGKSLGKSLGKTQGQEQDKALLISVKASVERMALANKVNSADIKVIVLAENAASEMVDIDVDVDVDSAIVVSSFAQAMLQLDVLIGQHALVALVGVNLAEILSHALSAEPEQQSSAGNDLAVEPVTTISFDETFTGYQHCHGIAAILFASISFAQSNNSYVYSWLKGFAVGDEVTNFTEVTEVTASALDNAQVSANDIGLLEVSALADNKLSLAESSGLIASYAHQKKLNTAVSCARSLTGEGAGFSQVFGLLRTIIALQQRYIPAITDWQQPAEHELIDWQNSSFYLATEARPWYPHPEGNAHLAAYSCLAANNDYCHVILAENKIIVAGEKHPLVDIRDNGFIACSDLKMVLVAADDQQSLLSKLTELENDLQSNLVMPAQSIQAIALSYYQQAKSIKNTYSIVLLCESKTELLKEVASAKSGIVTALATGKEWRTPKGSYFTPKPVNRDLTVSEDSNNVSFLYPGIGATYIGLGRDLLHLFPEIHQDVANLADDIGASLKDTLLNPRSVVRPSFKALKQLDLDLRGNLADIAEAGVGFACVFTKVFENVFKLKADFATGYSMGEVSMYAALGAWQQPGLMSARLANSDTFNERLCGDLLTLREHWGLPELSETTGKNDEFIWETYTIKATLAEVIAASEGEDRVYCTIINTPDSLLIAGYPEDCLRVIKKLGVRAMALNMANAIHSAPANIEYDDMVELYTMDVTSRLPTKMYSSSCYLPIPQLSKAIAHSVAKCLCERVDFPRLINTMYDQGARVFIEMGPGRSLCSWTDKILDFDLNGKGNGQRKPRVAVPVNAKGTSDELTYFRAVAKLISHGVTLDLQRLFYGSIIVQKK